MRFLRHVWFFAVLLVLFALLVLVCGTHLALIALWHVCTGDWNTTRSRTAIACWMMTWSDRLLSLFCILMRIRLDVRMDDSSAGMTVPHIVISNHLGSVETLILPTILRRRRFRGGLRGVGKRAFKSYFIVGWAVRAMRWAFVERRAPDETPEGRTARHARDLRRVSACTEGARADGACMLIYPEGTISTKPDPASDLRYLLLPRSGGIRCVLEAAPDHPVLSLTIHWGADLAGIHLPESAELFGRTITVIAHTIARPKPGDEDVDAWLNEEWRRKESTIARLEREQAHLRT